MITEDESTESKFLLSRADGTARDRLDQARALFALFPDVDRDYLERRVRYESAGDHGLEVLTP